MEVFEEGNARREKENAKLFVLRVGARPASRTNVGNKKCLSWDFPGSPVVKTLRFQCRGREFDSWSGN